MPQLLKSQRWELLPNNPALEEKLTRELMLSPLTARVLVARGVKTVEEANEFLAPSLERDWYDPLEIPGMDEACSRIEQALENSERIAVFGDFDVDGITSSSLLTLALRELGAEVFAYIPHRFGEGYGLSREALERVRKDCSPNLIVTVDNGIAAKEEVAWLFEQGIDVVITDHHEPGELVPEAVPVCDPKLDSNCRSRELAGAGVALKLVCELGSRRGARNLWRYYTDLAAMGTLSDMMLFNSENRALVADGFRLIHEHPRPGISALATSAGVKVADLTAESMPFSLIPRLNAAGRMGTTDIAFDLLMASNMADAQILAGKLEEINDERRRMEKELAEEALSKAEAAYAGGPSVVVWGREWHEGVKGIVASRLVAKYHVPAILFSIDDDGVAKGSGRSVGEVDLFQALGHCQDHIIRFGGHAGAVGVSCEESELSNFQADLDAYLSSLPAEQFEDKSEVTALVKLSELSIAAVEELEMLQPFGQGNKRPIFGVEGVSTFNRSRVGADLNHLRFIASDGNTTLPAIMFRVPNIDDCYSCDSVVDLVFEAVNEEWQGRVSTKLMVKDILLRTQDEASSEQQDFVEDIYSRADAGLERRDYQGITDADSFATKIVGVSFEGRQELIQALNEGDALILERDLNNAYDANAIMVKREDGAQLGFLKKELASELSPVIDEGRRYQAKVLQVTGGGPEQSLGVNIRVTNCDADTTSADVERKKREELRTHFSMLDEEALDTALRKHFIGDHELLPAQKEALQLLAAGRSCLAVMATGRGKSLIFHMNAAKEALLKNKASIFVYPLRALVADQSFHLANSFAELGLEVRVLTGESSLDERDGIFAELEAGACDCILTTPEFLAIHVDRFAESGRISFVVIDEAHHAGLSKGGNRSAYSKLPEIREKLGNPCCLAVTATAQTSVASEIVRLIDAGEEDVILDKSLRSNLEMDDKRRANDKESALVSLIARGEKSVVYVNSRDQAVAIARQLRKRIPELGHAVGFYHAGMSRDDRKRVEAAFREGILCCIVSTSAFGEGVNLPDIRHIVLYHMPFGQIEFNQMSGRAGRDGNPACIHLMFNTRDTRINEHILAAAAPTRENMAALYRSLMSIAKEECDESGSFKMTNADIAEHTKSLFVRAKLDEQSVSAGISVFRELGFLTSTGHGSARRLIMNESPEHMELTDSIRYLEGIRACEAFSEFSRWALNSDISDMLLCVNQPITPSFGKLVDS